MYLLFQRLSTLNRIFEMAHRVLSKVYPRDIRLEVYFTHLLPSLDMSIFGSNASTTEAKDTELVDPPNDSISCMSFSPTADYLAVGSWNHEVSQDVDATQYLYRCTYRTAM
jgi:hypothetical protein